MQYDFLIARPDAGARLDKWLSEQIEALTRTRLKALIEGGALSRDGAPFTDPSWKMRAGEAFQLIVPPAAPPTPKPENIPLDVYYEDDALIVVNKPAGLVVHPAAGHWTGTLVNALIHHCGDSLSGVGGVARPGIVHRLDKDTSGLMVVAKSDAAHQALTAAFSVHDIERVYDAVVVGAPRPGVGTIDAAIGRASSDRKKFAIVKTPLRHGARPDEDDAPPPPRPDARHAVTHYQVSEYYGRTRAKLKGDAVASTVACRLETGRTHQIRVHLSGTGYPLIGDPLYGRGPGLGGLKPGDATADHALAVLSTFRRQALHARVLGFNHPISGETLHFEAPPPADLAALQEALRAL